MTELLGSFSVRRLRKLALVHGAASALDLRGDTRHQYRFARNGAEADIRALRDDWVNVGEDMAEALESAAVERIAQ